MGLKKVYFIAMVSAVLCQSNAAQAMGYCRGMCTEICQRFYQQEEVSLAAAAGIVKICIESCMNKKCS